MNCPFNRSLLKYNCTGFVAFREPEIGPDILVDGSRIDDYFDSRQQYLYQFQPCDKLVS